MGSLSHCNVLTNLSSTDDPFDGQDNPDVCELVERMQKYHDDVEKEFTGQKVPISEKGSSNATSFVKYCDMYTNVYRVVAGKGSGSTACLEVAKRRPSGTDHANKQANQQCQWYRNPCPPAGTSPTTLYDTISPEDPKCRTEQYQTCHLTTGSRHEAPPPPPARGRRAQAPPRGKGGRGWRPARCGRREIHQSDARAAQNRPRVPPAARSRRIDIRGERIRQIGGGRGSGEEGRRVMHTVSGLFFFFL